MSIKQRILLLSSAGLAVIFLVYNLLIYVFFIKVTTNGELKLLWNKAQIVLRKQEVRQPQHWPDKGLLDEFLQEHSLLRIIGPDGTIRTEAYTDAMLARNPPVFRKHYHTKIVTRAGIRLLYIQVPIIYNKEQVGLLELGKTMKLLRDYSDVLITVLIFSSASAVLFSAIAGFVYTRSIFRPIKQLAGTMELIETSGTFSRLNPEFTNSRDELGRLGMTFNSMIGHLEENYNRQKQFVEDASHELRTPLTVIESYASMLKRWGGQNPDIVKEAADSIHQESVRLKGLVNSLLLLAKGKGDTLQWSLLDLTVLLRNTAAEMARSFKRQIEVITSDGGPIEMVGDCKRIKQLVIILLDNSLKFSAKTVRIEAEADESHVAFRVIDQGIGIEKSKVKHLFDRFYRVDSARNRKSGGIGLGLSIAKKIVANHNGTIDIESRWGEGTTVAVKLPRRLNMEKGILSEK